MTLVCVFGGWWGGFWLLQAEVKRDRRADEAEGAALSGGRVADLLEAGAPMVMVLRVRVDRYSSRRRRKLRRACPPALARVAALASACRQWRAGATGLWRLGGCSSVQVSGAGASRCMPCRATPSVLRRTAVAYRHDARRGPVSDNARDAQNWWTWPWAVASSRLTMLHADSAGMHHRLSRNRPGGTALHYRQRR